MSLKEKKAARREEENRILRQMTESGSENTEESSESESARAESVSAGSPDREKAGKAAGGYTPMTDEQIRKTRLILWPILLVIAVVVYLATHGLVG